MDIKRKQLIVPKKEDRRDTLDVCWIHTQPHTIKDIRITDDPAKGDNHFI